MATNVVNGAQFVGNAYMRLPAAAREFVRSHDDTPFTYNGWAFAFYECDIDDPLIPLCSKGMGQFDTYLEWKYDTTNEVYILFDRGYDEEPCKAQIVHSESNFDSVIQNLCKGLPVQSQMYYSKS